MNDPTTVPFLIPIEDLLVYKLGSAYSVSYYVNLRHHITPDLKREVTLHLRPKFCYKNFLEPN